MLSQASQVGIFPARFVAASQVPHSHIFSVWHSCKLTSRCGLLCQRRISSFACACALSCGRTGREDCQWYNLLPLGDAKPLAVKSNGHILSRLPAKERERELCCCIVPTEKGHAFFVKASELPDRVKEAVVLRRRMSILVHPRRSRRVQGACLLVTCSLENNVFEVVVVNPLPSIISTFISDFVTLKSPFL